MCSTTNSCGVSEARFGRTIASSSVIVAHEMGHNFNSNHDSSGNSCPSSGFIMAAIACSNCATWSSCSTNYINTFLPRATCLTNVPTIVYPDGNPCGNYVVDPGEDCDFGPAGSACCNGRTSTASTSCKWKAGAVCDNSNSCCSNCQLRGTSYMCRAASGECDLDDFCSASGTCTDVKKSNGTTCGTSGICSLGNCVSRNSQCSALNNFRFTVSTGSVSGPYTSCDSSSCFLSCLGTTPATCVNLQNFGLSNAQKLVAAGLSCLCPGGATGTCTGTSGTCNCQGATQPPTSPPPTSPPTAR